MATTSPVKPVAALRIISLSPMGPFRRAGRTWTTTASVVARKAFTKTQIEQLQAEPMLVVTEVTVDPAELTAAALGDDE